jgi:predicted CXXCH cytochrome family protein
MNCAKCHTTGFKLNLKDGVYKSTWVDGGAGCEACHGPGSHHVNVESPEKGDTIFNPANLHDDRRANSVCGSCHTRGKSTDGKYGYPNTYKVGDELNFHYKEVKLPKDKKRFWPDGTSKSHHQQFIDFKKSVMYKKGVKCWACHDPHKPSSGNGASLRLSGNKLCLSCHTQTTAKKNLTHSIHDNNNCISCHLPKTAKSALPYDISAHTFFAIPPTATIKFGNGDVKKQINSCVQCHYHKNTPTKDLLRDYNKVHEKHSSYKTAAKNKVK